MKDLLRFESRKLFHARILYICAGIIIGIILLLLGIQKLTDMAFQSFSEDVYSEYEMSDGTDYYEDFSDAGDELFMMGTGNTGLTWLLTALAPYVVMVFGVFTAIYVCGDFGNGTIKNVFGRGYSRTEVYFSKYLFSLFVLLGFGLLAMLVGFLGGTLLWKIGSGWGVKVILLILIQLIGVAAYNALFCFFAALLKRMGSAMVVCIATPFALPLILTLIDLLVMSDKVQVSDYWISGCITGASSMDAGAGDLIKSVLISVVYIAVFTVCGWLCARKREV